ncbi:MKRN2 opposite strand protein, partial [Aphis craccivora]
MNNDSGIISFQHCNHKNIYCINIPTNCPICKKCLKHMQNIPIRVPYPFVRASQQSCSI